MKILLTRRKVIMHWKDWLKRKNAKMTLEIMATINKLDTHDKLVEFFQAKGIKPPPLEDCKSENLYMPPDPSKIPPPADLGDAQRALDEYNQQKADAENVVAKSKPRKPHKPRGKTKKNEK